MKGKSKGSWLKLIGGPLQKRLENHQKTTCVYEGEYVYMKAKSKGFWLKLIGGPPRKMVENHEKRNLWDVLWNPNKTYGFSHFFCQK